jgi:hypothetical protein
MALIVGPSATPQTTGLMSTLLMTENTPLRFAAASSISKTGTVTGTAGFGSSLFLQRITLPAPMALSEIDAAVLLLFNGTSNGAGTMSRSMALYSFGNSSSLATVCSASGTSAWTTGSVTAGASSSLTQFQGGWSAGGKTVVQPMTFGATKITGGEYVVGQLFDFAQASSTWTVIFAGEMGGSISAFSRPTLAAASGVTGVSSYASQFLAMSTAGSLTSFQLGGTASTAKSSQTLSGSAFTVTLTNSALAASWQMGAVSSNSNIVSSIGLTAGSIVTAVSTASVASMIYPDFGFVGTGSSASGFSGQFSQGIMSTGAIPASIALTSSAVSYTGSAGVVQPWFALVGS